MCNCKTEIEAQLVERLKEKHPNAQGHKATLDGYGFVVAGNELRIRGCMPVMFGAAHANKKTGAERWKNEKGTMTFRFCPFCGENLLTGEQRPNGCTKRNPTANGPAEN